MKAAEAAVDVSTFFTMIASEAVAGIDNLRFVNREGNIH